MQHQFYATVGLLFAVAAQAYLLGCVNGAILVSRLLYGEDIRQRGSGNAGLTNFYRNYGAAWAPAVIATDMGKAALAVWVGGLLTGHFLSFSLLGKLCAGLFCVIGHMFPAFYAFHGGKGILCSGTLLLFLDWRVAVVSWAVFLLLWLTTRYVSLGSVTAAVCFPLMMHVIYGDVFLTVPALLIAFLVLWAHRENINRLMHGTERKFRFHIHTSEDEK